MNSMYIFVKINRIAGKTKFFHNWDFNYKGPEEFYLHLFDLWTIAADSREKVRVLIMRDALKTSQE